MLVLTQQEAYLYIRGVERGMEDCVVGFVRGWRVLSVWSVVVKFWIWFEWRGGSGGRAR